MMGKFKTSMKIIRTYNNWIIWFLLYFNLLKGKEYKLYIRNGDKFFIRTKERDIHPIGETYHLNEYPNIQTQKIKSQLTLEHIVVFFQSMLQNIQSKYILMNQQKTILRCY